MTRRKMSIVNPLQFHNARVPDFSNSRVLEYTADMSDEEAGPIVSLDDLFNKLTKVIDAKFGELKQDFGELKQDFGELKQDFGELKQDFGEMKQDFQRLEQKTGSLFEMSLRNSIARQFGDKYAESLVMKSLYDVVARLLESNPESVAERVALLHESLIPHVSV